MNYYNKNLHKNNANFVSLSLLFSKQKDIYPNYEAIIYENRKYTWSDVYTKDVLNLPVL